MLFFVLENMSNAVIAYTRNTQLYFAKVQSQNFKIFWGPVTSVKLNTINGVTKAGKKFLD